MKKYTFYLTHKKNVDESYCFCVFEDLFQFLRFCVFWCLNQFLKKNKFTKIYNIKVNSDFVERKNREFRNFFICFCFKFWKEKKNGWLGFGIWFFFFFLIFMKVWKNRLFIWQIQKILLKRIVFAFLKIYFNFAFLRFLMSESIFEKNKFTKI